MSVVGISDGGQLRAIAERVDAAAAQLQRDLVVGVEEVAKERIVPAIRRGADRLPRTGGLAAEVAAQPYDVHPGADKVTVSADGGMKSLAEIDAGRVNHPVYNDRSNWVSQQVAPGFASDAIRDSEDDVHRAIESTMSHTAEKITRRI